MNPVLAGLGMIAAALKLGAADPWGIKPLTRFPDDLELGEQFYSRVRKAEDFAHGISELLNFPAFEFGAEEDQDEFFMYYLGCSSQTRRSALIIEDRIAEVREITRRDGWNPYKAGDAWRAHCVKTTGSRSEYCDELWHEADAEWDNILVNQMEYKILEKRNCPALISGLGNRRIGR